MQAIDDAAALIFGSAREISENTLARFIQTFLALNGETKSQCTAYLDYSETSPETLLPQEQKAILQSAGRRSPTAKGQLDGGY